MKKIFISLFIVSAIILLNSEAQVNGQGVKWDNSYSFDQCNTFKIEAYASDKVLMRKGQYKIYYQSDGDNFVIKTVTEARGMGMETILDKKNEVGIQMFGTGGGAVPTYNAGGYKYPAEKDLKKLEIVPTNDTKEICGFTCKKYTYTYLKIFGEVWITDQVTLSNDLGVFRACKMAAKHNTLSIPGFVMEMTTEDAKGGKTLMTTLSLKVAEKYTIDLKGVSMTKAVNKVNYYIF